MNLLDKFGFTPIVGAVGAFSTWSVSTINEYLALAIGVATLVFTIGRCIDLFRKMGKK
jgi:hypothetical protein